MGDTTAIEWTDATWSPWEGCTKVSPGCDNCYAEAMNRWLHAGENWGPGAPRRIYSEDHWDKPAKWQRAALKFETLHGRRRRVFPSVCDPFDKEAPGLQRERLWGLIRLTPAINWLLLTKRIGNAKGMLPADWGDGYRNVWLGATVVNQDEADRDVPKLLATPARLRFLSCEPLLGPVDIKWCNLWGAGGSPGIDWIIAGGESGRGARPMHPDWARSLRDQCTAAGVPFMFKQWGEHDLSYDRDRDDPDCRRCDKMPRLPGRWINLAGGHGFNGERVHYAHRVGKKAAGRLLDGIEHNGFPA